MDAEAKIYVIDDDPGVLQFVTTILQEGNYQFEAFASGEDFVAHENGRERGCVITDQCLPGIQGTEIQDILQKRRSCFSLIVISGAADISTAVRAMKRGAITLLQKPFQVDELLKAVEEGITESKARQATRDLLESVHSRLALLTEGEMEVLKCLIKGMSHKSTASLLNLGLRSVDRHRKNVLDKMEVPTLQELIAILAKTELEGLPSAS